MGLQLNWESTCLADKRLRVRSSSIPPIYPDIGQLELLRMIRDHEIAGLNPAIRTIPEPVLISFALGAAVCWFESSLPDHYREVGKLVKPAIISVRSSCSTDAIGRCSLACSQFESWVEHYQSPCLFLSAANRVVVGSNPTRCYTASIAQLVEHLIQLGLFII